MNWRRTLAGIAAIIAVVVLMASLGWLAVGADGIALLGLAVLVLAIGLLVND